MRIEWIDGEREVPGIGLMQTGDVRDVDDALGKSLVRQNQAIAIKDRKEERGKGKEEKRPPGPARPPNPKNYNPVA
jgi:hypothetical protein